VRGSGLFWGIDLVRDRESRRPVDRAEAKHVVSTLCRAGVLMGLMGKHGNVLKIRPPLVFGRQHAELLLQCLEEALAAV